METGSAHCLYDALRESRGHLYLDGDGGGLEIGFNNLYLLEALKAAPADHPPLSMNSASSPCVIQAEDGDDRFLYMVLPVRLRAGNERGKFYKSRRHLAGCREQSMEIISIQTAYIRLDALLKFAGLAVTGGEAKRYIADGLVSVNGEPCRQRGRKIHPGDIVLFGGRTYGVRKTEH